MNYPPYGHKEAEEEESPKNPRISLTGEYTSSIFTNAKEKTRADNWLSVTVYNKREGERECQLLG